MLVVLYLARGGVVTILVNQYSTSAQRAGSHCYVPYKWIQMQFLYFSAIDSKTALTELDEEMLKY